MKLSYTVLSLAALTAAANAQCLVSSGTSIIGTMVPTAGFPANDEGVSPITPLGFTIDIGGTLYDHVFIGSNGMVEFAQGAAAVSTWFTGDNFGIGSYAELQGTAGQTPLLAPWSDDMVVTDILVDSTVVGELKITWVDATAYLNTDVFDFQCVINPAGATFSYGTDDYTDLFSANAVVGASYGNVAGTGADPEADLVLAGDTGTSGVLFELFDLTELAPPDLLDTSVLVLVNGTGGWTHALICGTPPNPPATHTAVGTGCYPINQFSSVYQLFPDALTSATALAGTSHTYVPNGQGGYTVLPAAGTLRPTTGATSIGLADELTVNVFLPVPFDNLGTPSATMSVCDSGAISFGGTLPTFTWWDDPNDFLIQTSSAFVGYGSDLDPGAAGDVLVEYDAGTGIFYVTFENVPHWDGATGLGDNTFQFQVNLAAGVVTIVYGALNDGGFTGQAVGIGHCDATSVNDMGGIDYATGLPYNTLPELVTTGVELSADVPAVSTATTGTTVTYSSAGAPDFSPTFLPGFKIGIIIASFAAPVDPGIDLFFLGAPGCPAHVGSLDVVEATDTAGAFVLPYPAGIPPLTSLTFQMAFLFDINDPAYPTSLAGQNGNTFVQTSNAILTTISDN